MTSPELIIWAIYWIVIFSLLLLAWRYACRVYVLKWYDLSKNGRNEEVTWSQIRELCNVDPMNFRDRNYSCWPRLCDVRVPITLLMRDAIFLILFFWFFYAVGKWIGESAATLSLENLENLAVTLGGGGLFLSVFGLFYNGRISTRSNNRQAWINELRNEINEIIADIPFHDAHEYQRDAALKRLNKRHAKIELYLNPSERVHRSFMTLIRFMYDVHDLEVDEEVREHLGIEKNDKAPQNQSEWKDRKSQIIRLANVLLKREWEQVKLIS